MRKIWSSDGKSVVKVHGPITKTGLVDDEKWEAKNVIAEGHPESVLIKGKS